MVCLTDGDTDALVKLRENIQHNHYLGGSIFGKQLLWGRQTSMEFLAREQQQFDVILASDVIYVPDIINPLWETIQTLLSKTGILLLAYARRKVPVSFELILSAAKDANFSYECLQRDDEEGQYLYAFRRKDDETTTMF